MSIYPPTGTLEIKDATLKIPVIDLQYTSNTAKIEANSNVVTEFPRSKKLIKYPRVALSTNAGNHSALGSGYTQDGYTVKVSSELTATFTGTKAFTNTNLDNTDTWISDQLKYSSGTPVSVTTNVNKFGQNGEWLEIKLPNKIKLSSTRIFSRRTYVTERNDTADIWASNTGTDGDWVKLTTINFNDAYTDVIPMVADIDTLTYYQYFAIQITEVGWTNGTYVNIGEWELFGVPEYDPEAHGIDVTLKSKANVPNTDWLEVYYDAKGLSTGTVTNPISGLGGTTNGGTAVGDTQVSNGAFVFDGSGDYIYNSQSGYTSRVMYTGCVWIKKASATNGCIFQFGNGSNNSGIGLFSFGSPTETKTMRAFVYGGADADYTGDVPLNEWFHVVAVIYNTDATLYLNGVEVATDTRTTAITIPSTPYLSLGVQTNSSNTPLSSTYFDGSIANFRLFNRALTSDEIYQLYAYQKEYFGHGDLSMTLKAGRLGIGTSEPRAALDVRGDIYGGCPAYFQVLYNANLQAARYDVAPYGTLVPWNTLFEHKGGCFDTSTGLFTAPVDGLYRFGYSMRKQTGSYGDFWTYVQKNGSPLNGSSNSPGRVYVDGGSSGASVFASQTFILDLSVGDTVGIIIATTSSIDARISNSYNYFHGYYIGRGNGSFGSYSY